MRVLVLFVVALSACDFPDRMMILEAKVKALEEQAARMDDSRGRLAGCIADADKSYWEDVKLNGGKKKPGTDVWIAPGSVFDLATQRKRNAIAECQSLYGK